MLQSIGHVGLFVSKLLGAIFGALMLTFLLSEFTVSFSSLTGMEALLIVLGGLMAIGLLGGLFRPMIGGGLAVLAILGINMIAVLQQDAHFEFDFPLQFVLGLALVGFSLLIRQGES